jgi:hypothetical protein
MRESQEGEFWADTRRMHLWVDAVLLSPCDDVAD